MILGQGEEKEATSTCPPEAIGFLHCLLQITLQQHLEVLTPTDSKTNTMLDQKQFNLRLTSREQNQVWGMETQVRKDISVPHMTTWSTVTNMLVTDPLFVCYGCLNAKGYHGLLWINSLDLSIISSLLSEGG